MFKRTNLSKRIKSLISIFLMFTVVFWALGPVGVLVPPVQAYSMVDVRYINDGGASENVFLEENVTAEVILSIEAFESAGSGNVISSITLQVDAVPPPGGGAANFTASGDLAPLAGAGTSGVALYLDADGNGSFSTSTTPADTLLSTGTKAPSAWSTVSSQSWRTTFSNLAVAIPTSYSSSNTSRIFVVARAAAGPGIIDTSPMKAFSFSIPVSGIDVTVGAGATLTDWPTGFAQSNSLVNLGTEGGGQFGAPIVISEFKTGSTDSVTDEFIELYNMTGEIQDISTYSIQYRGSGSAIFNRKNLTGSIPAYGFYLIGNVNGGFTALGTDVSYATSTLTLSATGGTIFLVANQTDLTDASSTAIRDKVAYGTGTYTYPEGQEAPAPALGKSMERKAYPESSPSKMAAGGIHAAKGNSEDSQNNSMDFVLQTTPVPQNSTSDAENPMMTSGGSDLLINEVLYNATSTGGWIELYNRGGTAVNINGYSLQTSTSTVGSKQSFTLATSSLSLSAGQYLVVYWNATGTDDLVLTNGGSLYTNATTTYNNMSTYGGDVALKNNAATIVDYVAYGTQGSGFDFTLEKTATSTGQWMSGDRVPPAVYGQSIGRRSTTGGDTNSSSDWQTYSSPSAGLPNMGGDSTAPSAVTNVGLVDSDSTYGIDGRDFTIAWTASPTTDPTFDRYEIYILPDGTDLDTAIHSAWESVYGQTTASYTGSQAQYQRVNSAGSAISNTGSFRAYVIGVDFAGNRSTSARSAAVTITSDAGAADTAAPYINHVPVWLAEQGQNLTFVAQLADDRQVSEANVIYRVDSAAWGNATSSACLALEAGWYTCAINWNGAWNADTTIYYYLRAVDSSGNVGFVNSTGYITASTTAANSPFNIDIMPGSNFTDADSNVDLSGTVYNSAGTPLAGAYLFVEGLATTTIQSDASGNFQWDDNSFATDYYYLHAFKNGYMDRNIDFQLGNTRTLYMDVGYMNTTGDMSQPTVTWTAPSDGMMGAPTNISCTGGCTGTLSGNQYPILIGFSKPMNANTINDLDASNAGSNIYLTTNGNDRASGQVVYNSANQEARFYSSTALSANTFYMAVISSGVTDSEGNPITSNQSGGSYVFSFTTMFNTSNYTGSGGSGSFTDQFAANFGTGGAFMPPYVKGVTPGTGATGVMANTAITIEFSESMMPSSMESAVGQINGTVQLIKVTDLQAVTGTQVPITVSLDSQTRSIATITPVNAVGGATAAALNQNTSYSGMYKVVVTGAAQSTAGAFMGNSGAVAQNTASYAAYSSQFQVTQAASATDSTAPTITGTNPNNNQGITSGTTAVDVSLSSIDVGFSEGMNPSGINAQNITLKSGTTNVAGTVSYSPTEFSAMFIPTSALRANTTYVLQVSTEVADLASNRLAATSTTSFKTGSADSTAPTVLYANGDDYQIAMTFSEAMNVARQTDTTNWTTSVLNPANYYLSALVMTAGDTCTAGSWSCYPTPTSPYGSASAPYVQLNASALSNLSFSYDGLTQTVTIKGFGFGSAPTYFQIFADNVTDKSNNVISDSGIRANWSGNIDYDTGGGAGDRTDGFTSHRNAARAPKQNSSTTYGMLGPGGGPSMMMGGMGGPAGGGGGPMMDMGQMGMMKAGAMPMNSMAGQTSNYFVDVPVTKALVDEQLIILTFPRGFDVTNVVRDTNSPVNSDFNDFSPGTVTFDTAYNGDGIAVSASARTVTVKLNLSVSTTTETLRTTVGPEGFVDFLHFDIKGVVNSTVPKDFGTTGYQVDIKSMAPDGALLENITTMPFFLTQAGDYKIMGTVRMMAGDGTTAKTIEGNETMTIYLGSPMTGPMEKTLTFTDASTTVDYEYTGLPQGEYHIFTDPVVSILENGGAADSDFEGAMMPEPMWLPDAANANYYAATSTLVKNITLKKFDTSAGAKVTVKLKGNFSSGGTADDVDVFAPSSNGARVKTLSAVGNVANPNATATVMYLSEGDWMMGVGPAMPKGAMMGPPKMRDWMEPAMANIKVGIETATSRNLDPDGNGDAAVGNQGQVRLAVASTKNFNVGDLVTFATGDGNGTTTITALAADTSITVTPQQSNWATLPAAADTIYTVRETSDVTNDSQILFDISTQSALQIKGVVIDDSGNAVASAELWAYQPQGGFGGSHATADTNGKFALKIGSAGIWTIGAMKPGLPPAKDKSVDVRSNSSNTDGNTTADVYFNSALIIDANDNGTANSGDNLLTMKLKRPGYTISGKVLNASQKAIAYAPVWAYQTAGFGHADTMTDSSGNYILYVDNGVWQVEADAPGVGFLRYDSTITISSVSQSNINLAPASNLNFYDISGNVNINGSNQTFIPLRVVKFNCTTGAYGSREYGGSTDSSGNYTISVPGPGTGEVQVCYRVDTWTPDYGEVAANNLDGDSTPDEAVDDEVANNPANIIVTSANRTNVNILIAAANLKTVSIQFNNGTASQRGFLHIEEVDYSGTYPKPTGRYKSLDISGLNATTTVKIQTGTVGSPKQYFLDLDVPGYGFFAPDAGFVDDDKGVLEMTGNATSVEFTLPNVVTGVVTISGTVTDSSDSSNVSNGWAWIGNPLTNFNTGVAITSGSYSITVPKLSSGSYQVGAEKSGYMSAKPTNIAGTANTTVNFSLSPSTLAISGYIYADASGGTSYSYDSGEAIANGFVWAEEVSTGRMTHAPADATGYYSLGVVNGTWKIMAGADGYLDTQYRSTANIKQNVTVSGSAVTANIRLSSDSNWSTKTKAGSITPSSGGTVDDTASGGTGVKMTIPPNALGSSSSAGNVKVAETSAVTKTNSAVPLGGKGKSITAADNSGTAITTLNDYIDVEMVYYKSEIEAMDIVDESKLKPMNTSYFDSSMNDWVGLSTTKKAYYKQATDTEWTLYPDSATQTGYEQFIDDALVNGTLVQGPDYDDYKLVLKAQTNHLTVFGATNPKDNVLPSAPAGLAQSSGDGSSVVLTWSTVTTNYSGTAIADLLGYEIYRSSDNSSYSQLNTSNIATGTTPTYTDSSVSAWTSYYYKVTTADDGGNETVLASSTALQVCSTNTVANGTVASDCTITCNSGYTTSGNSCVASGGAGPGAGVSSGPPVIAAPPAQEAVETPAEAVPAKEVPAPTLTEKAKAFAQKVVEIVSEAVAVIKANVNVVLEKVGAKRSLNTEEAVVKKYIDPLVSEVSKTKVVVKESQQAMTNFVAYGTPTTVNLGAGERAGVLYSFEDAFGKLPETQTDWEDAIKVANGRWPKQTAPAKEAEAKAEFEKIYLREPDRSNAYDDAAVVIMTYGLKPAHRSLDNERSAMKSFVHIYKRIPGSNMDWKILRAIAESGASREKKEFKAAATK